jgi:hypothetical protein
MRLPDHQEDRLEMGRNISFNPASRKSLEAGAIVGISDVQSIAAEGRLYRRSRGLPRALLDDLPLGFVGAVSATAVPQTAKPPCRDN